MQNFPTFLYDTAMFIRKFLIGEASTCTLHIDTEWPKKNATLLITNFKEIGD